MIENTNINNIPNNTNNANGVNNKPKIIKKRSNTRNWQLSKREYFATGIRVSNLPSNIDLEALSKYFSQFGKLNGVTIKNGPRNSHYAEVEFTYKGCANRAINALASADEENSLLPENTSIIQLQWSDDNLDPFITASLNETLPYSIYTRTQKVFKKLLITPSQNTQLDKDVLENLFQQYGKLESFRFTPTCTHILYQTPQQGVNALFALDELVLPTTTLQIHFGRVEPLQQNWKEQRISLCISRLPLTAKRSHIKIACAGFGEVYIRPTFLSDNNTLRKRIYVDFVNQKEGKEALNGLQEHFATLGYHGVHVNVANNRLPGDINASSSNNANNTSSNVNGAPMNTITTTTTSTTSTEQ